MTTLPYISGANEIPNAEYHTGGRFREFISSTVLKNIDISPKWLRYCQEHPEDDQETKDWKLDGGCYHALLSSVVNTGGMDEFNANCVIFEAPVNPSTGNAYGNTSQKFIDAYEAIKADNPGKEIYTRADLDHAEVMVQELRFNNKHLSPIINQLIKIGKAEVSTFVEHKANDFIQADFGKFKTRKDLYTESKIIDWKGVQAKGGKEAPLRAESFARVIQDRGYDFSAAMYQYIDWMVTGKWRSFFWVVQDKNPPYDFNIISADGWAFEVNKGQMVGIGVGAMRMLKSMEAYLYCLEKDDFPGVSVFTKPDYRNQRIARSKVPGYANQKDIDYYF